MIEVVLPISVASCGDYGAVILLRPDILNFLKSCKSDACYEYENIDYRTTHQVRFFFEDRFEAILFKLTFSGTQHYVGE